MAMTMEEGISASYAAADPGLVTVAEAAVMRLAYQRRTFNTDDVIDLIESSYGVQDNYSFLGGVMRRAVGNSVVDFADCSVCSTYRIVTPSTRETQHRKNIPTYRSLIFSTEQS